MTVRKKSGWVAETPTATSNRPQGGKTTIGLTAASFGFNSIVFPTAFSSAPAVVVSTQSVAYFGAVLNVTTTGCDVFIAHRDGTNATISIVAHWVAVL